MDFKESENLKIKIVHGQCSDATNENFITTITHDHTMQLKIDRFWGAHKVCTQDGTGIWKLNDPGVTVLPNGNIITPVLLVFVLLLKEIC